MKRQTHITPLVLILMLLWLTLPACTAAPTATQAPPPATPEPATTEAIPTTVEMVKLKVVTQPFITFAPYYIALKEGYFSEQGLDVELINFNQAQQILPALSSGQVDVSSGLVSAAMFNAIARGGNIKVTSDKGYIDPQSPCPNYALIARSDLVAEIQSAADLKGRAIDVVPATFLEFYLAKILEKGNLTLKDITPSDLPAPSEPAAFANKAIDMTLNSEPWITRFNNEGHLVVLDSPKSLLPGSHGALQLFGPSLLGEAKDTGVRFMVAYLKAVQQYNQGKTDRNVELIAEFTQLDPGVLKAICWPSLRDNGQVNIDSLVEFQEWAQRAGYMETTVSPEQFWDSTYVDEANKILGGD